MTEKAICPYCGKQFEKERYNKRFCSVECQVKYSREKAGGKSVKPLGKAICPICGSEFEKHSYNHVYCQSECSIEAQKRRASIKKPQIVFCCVWCHEAFKARQFRMFCSPECTKKFAVIKRRIITLYPFDHRSVERELTKLKRLGGWYRFSGENAGFNDYFRLELLEKAKEGLK